MHPFAKIAYLIDRPRKPLSSVLPELDRLLRNPREVLGAGEITIGSAPQRGMAFLFGFFIAVPISWCVFMPAWLIISQLPKENQEIPIIGIMIFCYVLGVLVAERFLRGRWVVMRVEGVEF